MAKVWFITGAARGFGRLWAQAALERGDCVTLMARNPQDVQDLVGCDVGHPGGAAGLPHPGERTSAPNLVPAGCHGAAQSGPPQRVEVRCGGLQ